MDGMTGEMLLVLVQMSCVIIVFAYLVTRTKMFREVMEDHLTWKNQLFLIAVFGLISVYGTYSGMDFMGAKVNVRDLGPMIAGLVGGPIAGVGAGLIGGLHRFFFMDGPTTLSCSLATVFAGLLGGLIYVLSKRRFPGVLVAVAFAVFQESFHMGLALLLVEPYPLAEEIVAEVGPPMILVNSIGVLIFSYIIVNLYRERRTEKERDTYLDALEKERLELEIAKDIQTSFLPRRLPTIPGYEMAAVNVPAQQVGGDFYDFIELPDGRLGLVIADVSGKGVPGAIFMALSRTVVRVSSSKGAGPALALQEANRTIAEDSSSGMFVTLFYGVLDPSTAHLTYASGGHNPPMLLRGDDLTYLEASGIALGAMDDVDLEEKNARLQAGDLLVLYTDGVTEATSPGGELFGEERLEAVVRSGRGLSSKDALLAIQRAVQDFASGSPQSDDVTLVVIKVVGRER